MKFSGENPAPRVAAKRWRQAIEKYSLPENE